VRYQIFYITFYITLLHSDLRLCRLITDKCHQTEALSKVTRYDQFDIQTSNLLH